MLCTRSSILSGGLILSYVLSSIAAAKIEVDKETFDCGTVIEGKKEKIAAVFEIKNTGNIDLKLESVRPSCGCTVVEYDTIIAPGKTGKIKPEVNLRGFSGKINKSVTVMSNADNNPTLRLNITAEIQPIIDISERYLMISALKDIKNIYFSSLKKNLEILDVSFKAHDNNDTKLQKTIQLPIKYEWIKTDSIRNDGFAVFMLSLKNPFVDEPLNGDFILKTNHPDKSELSIRVKIEKN